MCGIVGVVAAQGECFERGELVDMQQLLLHRGPDGSGIQTWTWGSDKDQSRIRLGLAHTRLAILDLTEAAQQPMSDSSAELTLVFNGEIYNYIELRAQLVGCGHKFTSTGDTEVLLAAYREWGTDCFQKLKGMYGVIIVDQRSGELVAARDPFGIKPLYFCELRRGWAFASEIKALRRLPEVRARANAASVLRYLRFGSSDMGTDTMFADVHQIAPGQAIRLDLDTLESRLIRHYKLPRRVLSTSDISFTQASDQLRELFLESLSLHYRSDVAVGSALSGGIDSSSICLWSPGDLGAQGRYGVLHLRGKRIASQRRALGETGKFGDRGNPAHRYAGEFRSVKRSARANAIHG